MAIGRVDNITNISVLNPNVLPYNRAETLIPFRDKLILEILAFTAPGATNVRSETEIESDSSSVESAKPTCCSPWVLVILI